MTYVITLVYRLSMLFNSVWPARGVKCEAPGFFSASFGNLGQSGAVKRQFGDWRPRKEPVAMSGRFAPSAIKLISVQSSLYSRVRGWGVSYLPSFRFGAYMDLIHSSEQKKCPRCSSRLVHKSRRRGLAEKVAYALLQISPYRCGECDHRYFRWRSSNHAHMHRAA